jgi:hypothetical protein
MTKYFLFQKKISLIDNQQQLINQFIDYNQDYSNHGYSKPYYSLPFNFDYCKDCQNTYPNRIVYSEKSFQELRKDSYKNIKPNNYADLNAALGELNHLFLDKDKLYALTDKSLVFIPIKAQTIKTNDALVYLGTGDITSIPQQAITTTEFSYSGTKDYLTVQNTEFGTIYYNKDNRTLFMLSDGLKELTMKGMRRFFKKHGGLNINKDMIDIYMREYPFSDKYYYQDGIGFTSGYDPLNKRYLLTKIDYRLTNLAKTKIADGLLEFDFVTKK